MRGNKKSALVTGASSGIGRAMAFQLARYGFDLIIIARREERLKRIKEEIQNKYRVSVVTYCCDLSKVENCVQLCHRYKNEEISILVNCAGFGILRDFEKIPLKKECEMINVNVLSCQILTKWFCRTMRQGRILNVCSSAAFVPDPLMASYGATKAYILQYSRAVNFELKKRHVPVTVSVLCPGPVRTEFFHSANIKYSMHPQPAKKVANFAVKEMLKSQEVICPSISSTAACVFSKLVPDFLSMSFLYCVQKNKIIK